MRDKNHRSSILIDSILQYGGAISQGLTGASFYIVIIKILPETSVGLIALFSAIVGLLNIVFSVGLGQASRHFVSFNIGTGNFTQVKFLLRKILTFGVILSFASFLSLYFLSPFIGNILLLNDQNIYLLKLLGIILAGNVIYGILNGILIGLQNFKESGLINMLFWIIYYILTAIVTGFTHNILSVLEGWIFGIVVGLLIESYFVYMAVKNINDVGSIDSSVRIFSYSLPIFMSSIIAFGSSYIDKFLVAGFLSLAQLGIYNLSLLITTSLSFIVTPFHNILLPKFSQMYGEGNINKLRQNVKTSSTLLSAIYIPIALCIASISNPLIILIAGSNYELSVIPLNIMLFSSALFINQNIFFQALYAIRITKPYIVSSTLSLFSNITLSVILIPFFGMIGASIGFSSVYVFTFFILFLYGNREKIIMINYASIIKIWLSSIIMYSSITIISRIFGYNSILICIYLLMGFLIYMMSVKIMGIFTPEEKEIIKSFLPQNKRLISEFIHFML